MEEDDFKEPRRPKEPPPAAAAAASSRPVPGGPGGRLRSQRCGKDLDAARRQRHAHRCLDEVERLRPTPAGGPSECPLYGRKALDTLESRGSHLKRCAARRALPPPLLLQATRHPSATLASSLPTAAAAAPPLSGQKRKVSSCPEQSTKKRRTSGIGVRMGAAEEELLVAMAMSRSLHEEEEAAKARLLTNGRQNRARQGRRNPRGEKKNRPMPPQSPPTLLLQDPEEARRHTEERVALLLAEADEFPGTPPLPPSWLLASELSRKVDWPVAVPKGPPSSLWERSSLVGLSALGPVCVAGLALPAWRGQTDQRSMPSTALPLLGSDRLEAAETPLQGRGCGRELRGTRPREEEEEMDGCSQEEGGALQDLMALAGEGLTLTQWNPAAQQAEEPGQEGMPGDVLRSCHLDRSLEEEEEEKPPPLGSCSPPVLLGSLAAAFRGMVNNPHLSDVQIQVDSGELFYAHLFVLYARCPELMEVVDQTGFWVAEEGEAKARRVLLSNVSGEAAGVFLSHLYTAEHLVPQHLLSEVAALALRFGVAELAALCTARGWSGQPAAGASGREEEEERGERFEALLESIWVGEEEEDNALLPGEPGREDVEDGQELEEINAFAAATQWKAEEEEEERRSSSEGRRVAGVEAGAVPGGSSEGKGSLGLEPSPLEPPRDAQEQRPLGAASRRRLEGPAEPSRELGGRSPLAGSWGAESWELFQESHSGRAPSEDAAASEDAAVIQSPTPLGPEGGLVPLSLNFSGGGSQVLLGALADELPASPRERGRFPSSDLSLPLFSPAPQEASGKPCCAEERELPKLQRVASAGTAASRSAGNVRRASAPPPSPPSPPVDLEGAPTLTWDPADERELGQGKQPAERTGLPPKERGAPGAMNSHLSWEVDSGCCQGREAPLLRTLLSSEADAGGERTRVPGTPLLTRRGPEGGQVAKLGLTSGPGEAQDSGLTLASAPIPSPKRQSLQGWLPLGQRSPPPWSSACLPADGKAEADVVVILDDSEEEAEAASRLSWGSSVLEADLPVLEEDSGHLPHEASPEGLVAAEASSGQLGSLPRPLLWRDGTPPGGSRTAGKEPSPCSGCPEEGSCGSDGSCSRGLDLWGQGDETDLLPLPRRLPAPRPVPKTPDLVCQEREALCTTPPTPMPSYSLMETPVLKKELSRFGVRTLPKQQMVLKLKEIFQYTHQTSDSRDAAASSQPGLCRRTRAALRSPKSAAAHRGFPPQQLPGCPEFLPLLLAGERFGGSSGAGDQGQMAQRGCLPAGPGRQKRAAEGPVGGGQALVAFQEADGLSGAASDTSVVLQSSSTDFETSVLAEEGGDVSAPPSTCREADVLVALRQYLRSRPALCRQILFYQPFELARLQSDLKQNGIRIALGRLLEFLDAHCITFTTSEARREKQQQQSERQGRGRRRC